MRQGLDARLASAWSALTAAVRPGSRASPAPLSPAPSLAAPPPIPPPRAITPNILWLLEQFEGRKLTPYLCPAGVPTIGIGSTRHPDGRRVTMADPPITDDQANAMARADLAEALNDVDNILAGRACLPHQRAALALFVHNLGPGALQDSTLLRRIWSGELDQVPAQFDRWSKARDPRTRQLVPLLGLRRRRRAEAYVFQGLPPAEAHARALADWPA
jgi:lysozyme